MLKTLAAFAFLMAFGALAFGEGLQPGAPATLSFACRTPDQALALGVAIDTDPMQGREFFRRMAIIGACFALPPWAIHEDDAVYIKKVGHQAKTDVWQIQVEDMVLYVPENSNDKDA